MFQKKSFRKSQRTSPEVPTSSLPDIVFMLLFFFMVVTVINPEKVNLEITEPTADQAKKIKDRTLVRHIYIGYPSNQNQLGDQPRIQLNDAFAPMEAIPGFIEEQRPTLPEHARHKMIVSLKVDENTPMGTVTGVKEQLIEAQAYKINYATLPDARPE